jgi:polyhydroxyalkanoate synthesis regulator phasin
MTYKLVTNASSISRDYGYTAGGYTTSNSAVTEKYDDVINTWTTKGNLNTARYTLAGFSLNGYGYTAGGTTGSNSTVTEKYDDVANLWTTKGSLNTARYTLAGFSLNGYGYTAGGFTGSYSAVTEKYDDVANTWSTKGNLNITRSDLTGFSLNGYGYSVGGYHYGISKTTEKYDDIANIWTTKADVTVGTYGIYMSVGFPLNSYGYVTGGDSGTLNATGKYDDTTNTWTVKGNLNTGRYYLSGFSLNGYGYTAGGTTGSNRAVTEKYDDIANTWTTKGNLNTARYGLAGFSLGALQAGVKNPEINPIYKTINKSKTTSIWLGAEMAYFPATNPAVYNEVPGSTIYAGWSYLAFDDTTAQTAVWRVPLSKYDGGNIVVKAFSKPQTTPTGAVTLQYNILTIGLVNGSEFNTAILADITTAIIASNTVQYSDNAAVYPSSISYILIKSIQMISPYSGSWRIYFEVTGSTMGYGKIYKNGVSYGTERSAGNWTGFTEDFTNITTNAGDTIEIWGREINGSLVGIRNFQIDFDYNSVNINQLIHSLSTSTLSTQVQIASAMIDPTNVATDNLLVIGISRDVVSDNLVGNGQLLGILLEYTKA